jgi:hypothetical protein
MRLQEQITWRWVHVTGLYISLIRCGCTVADNILIHVPQTTVYGLCSVVMKLGSYTLQLFYKPYIGKINLKTRFSLIWFLCGSMSIIIFPLCAICLHIDKCIWTCLLWEETITVFMVLMVSNSTISSVIVRVNYYFFILFFYSSCSISPCWLLSKKCSNGLTYQNVF